MKRRKHNIGKANVVELASEVPSPVDGVVLDPPVPPVSNMGFIN